MTKRFKALRLIAAMLGAAAALALLATGLSYGLYGRSPQASVYELLLRARAAKHLSVPEETGRLEARRDADEPRTAPPKKQRFHCDLRELDFGGMQVFTLEGGDGATVLYLHGGAYVNGFNAHQWRFIDALAARARCRVIAPAYHLAPWGDCGRAYRELTALYRELISQSPGRLILMGDSAGGGLALGLAESLLQSGDALPERLILFSPWVDVTMENPDAAAYVAVEPMLHLDLMVLHGRYWAGGESTRHWRVSPLYGEMAGLPPVYITCGTRELLRPDILLARDRLANAGVDVTLREGVGLNHDYPLMPLPEAEAVLREVTELCR